MIKIPCLLKRWVVCETFHEMFTYEINIVIIDDQKNKQEEIIIKAVLEHFFRYYFVDSQLFFYFLPLRYTTDRIFTSKFRGFMNLQTGHRMLYNEGIEVIKVWACRCMLRGV
jgi:hypothetical protein